MKVATCQERLNELFDRDPRNDSAIAASLGVTKQALCAWRNGSRSPKKSALIRIAEIYGVSIEWLMGFEEESSTTAEPRTEEARILARGIDKLSPEQREQALSVIRAMFASHADYFTKENDDET